MADSASHSVPDRSRQLVDLLGGRLERVYLEGADDTAAALFRGRMEPGRMVPLHSHRDPECFQVVSGRIAVFVDDDRPGWRDVAAGESILVSDGVRHAVRNPDDRAAEIVVLTNGRLARFYAEGGRIVTPDTPAAPPGPDDVARVIGAAERFGYWLATPQESAEVTGVSAGG